MPFVGQSHNPTMPAVLSANIPSLGRPRTGKVRDVFDLGDRVLIVATDRISAFDVVMANGVPDKGKILNQMSAFWFDKLSHVCPNHVVSTDDSEIRRILGFHDNDLLGRSTLAVKAEPLMIECVARAHITGSLFKEYRSQGGGIHGLGLPTGLLDGSKLPEPIFTPATKAVEGHDENISFNQAVDIVGLETAELVRDWTLRLFSEASDHAASVGFLLADTKFEFGVAEGGVVWIDEALSPDSSRYWEAEKWAPGGPQPGFDKQYVRDYLERSGWNKQPPGPLLPQDVVDATRDKYIQAYERITGQTFVP